MTNRIKELVENYRLSIYDDSTIRVSCADKAERDGVMDEIKACKEQIIAYLKETEAAKKLAAEERAKERQAKVV